MGNKLKRAVGKAVIALSCISMVFLLNISASAYWTNQTTYSNQTISCSAASQNQSGTVTLPSGAYAYYASTDNGSVSFSQSGNTVTFNTSGGTSSTVSSQIWDATKYSKTASATVGPQSSQTFPSTYSYNDGTYSGTLNQSGSANLVSGLPSDSKTATYDYTDTYSATATITSIANGTIYFSWYYPTVDTYYSYTDSQGYLGTLTFTGYNNATYVSCSFNFPQPNYVGQTSSGTCTHIFHYSGTVTRPDTRQWTMNYSGTAYAGGYDTVTSTVYNYNVTVYYYTVSSVWVQDNTPPDGNATLSPSGVTSGNVVISFTATDSGSGVKSTVLPDKSVVYSSSVTYTATDNGTYDFTITDNDGNSKTVPVTVSNIDRTVSVTHPVAVTYSINPNSSTPFLASDISLINNSMIDVKVSVQSLSASSGGTLVMNDVSQTKYANWNRLTASLTKSDIALGISVRETSTGTGTWASISQNNPVYAASLSSPVLFGILNPNGAAGNLKLSASYGLAWDGSYIVKHNLVLIFSIT